MWIGRRNVAKRFPDKHNERQTGTARHTPSEAVVFGRYGSHCSFQGDFICLPLNAYWNSLFLSLLNVIYIFISI